MANLSATISSGVITLIDNTGNVQRITTPIPSLSASVTACFYESYFQIGTGSTSLTLPQSTIWLAYIRNLHASNTISITATPSGGSAWASALVIPAGGVFLICTPYTVSVPGAGGVTVLSVLASGASTPAEIFLAA